MVGEGRELKPDAPWVGLVDEEQIDQWRRLEQAGVAVAVGHRTVSNLEEHLVEPLRITATPVAEYGGPRRGESRLQQLDHRRGPLQAAAHVEEQPARTAGHAFHAEPGEGGEFEDHGVEVGQHIGEPARRERDGRPSRERVTAHPGEDLPGVNRDPVADDRRCPPETIDALPHTALPRSVVHERLDLRVHLPQGARLRRRAPFGSDMRRSRQCVEQHRGLSRAFLVRLRCQPVCHGAQQAGRSFGPLNVSPEPVEVIGHPTREIVTAAA